LRNIIKKFIIYRYIQNKEEVFFIDEGITHIAFNIFVDIDKKIDDEEIKRFLKTLPKVDRLIVIDAEDSDLLDRVIKRGKEGHRRINFDSDEDVELFMKQSRIVLNVIKKELKGYIYMNVGREIKTKEIIQNIGLENV
jgi:dihydroorotase-like cyclic amidohydrolase